MENRHFKPKFKNKHPSHGGEIHNIPNKDKLLDFSININHLATAKFDKNIIKKSLEEISIYPDSEYNKLKEAIISHYHLSLTSKNIIVGNGAMDLITCFCDAFIHSNDRVIIIQPTFSEYEWAANKNEGIIENIFRKPEDDFQLPIEEIIENLNFLNTGSS